MLPLRLAALAGQRPVASLVNASLVAFAVMVYRQTDDCGGRLASVGGMPAKPVPLLVR
jgi:hypothetical protein